MINVPSEIVIVVDPLLLVPMPIDVATNTPVEAGEPVVETATEAGETVTIVVSLLTAVNVPLKPFSTTEICWLALTPPKAMLAGVAISGIGVGEGLGEGVGLGLADAAPIGVAVAPAADVAEVLGVVPPPPQATSAAKKTALERAGRRVTYQSFGRYQPLV
jgi:hypothetical protein